MEIPGPTGVDSPASPREVVREDFGGCEDARPKRASRGLSVAVVNAVNVVHAANAAREAQRAQQAHQAQPTVLR